MPGRSNYVHLAFYKGQLVAVAQRKKDLIENVLVHPASEVVIDKYDLITPRSPKVKQLSITQKKGLTSHPSIPGLYVRPFDQERHTFVYSLDMGLKIALCEKVDVNV